MALSPIEMFRSNESSLAQILQGGSQTISGIMDKAIQIGRDMSNNQRGQEQDLFAMRRNETALQQRRAENLQQNNEDSQRFARNAFENDRKFGADQTQLGVQNSRQATQDLFQQSNSDRNYQLNVDQGDRAERSVGVSEGGLKLRQDELEAERAAKKADREYFRTKYGNSGVASDTASLFGQGASRAGSLATDTAFDVEGQLSTPAPTQAPAQASTDIAALYQKKREREADYAGAKDPQVRARIGAELGAIEGQIAQLPKPRAAAAEKTPEAKELERLNLAAARRKGVDSEIEDIVNSNPSSFPGPASKYEEDLRIFAAKNGKTPDEALYLPEFDATKREAIVSAQKEQKVIERNAINQAATEDAYVKLLPGATEAQKENRRLAYRAAKRKGVAPTETPGAPPSAAPAQSELDDYLK